MEKKTPDVRDSITELIGNIGTIGVFMLSEIRVFLKNSWGASREEFFAAVDKAATNLKRSGKMAVADIEIASAKIKDAWEILDRERNLDWDNFINDLKPKLAKLGALSKDTIELCLNQAKELLDKRWTAFGRLGEKRVKQAQEHSDEIAEVLKTRLGSLIRTARKTGKKLDRAFGAAWDEMKKKD
ncbi:MAG: hypothetical protein M0T73_00890 [Deltaproteobacteria bacterium]|nr:hypothetical protein [Deltaproteobacteria bacterium]